MFCTTFNAEPANRKFNVNPFGSLTIKRGIDKKFPLCVDLMHIKRNQLG
jgi:hypothetical protein